MNGHPARHEKTEARAGAAAAAGYLFLRIGSKSEWSLGGRRQPKNPADPLSHNINARETFPFLIPRRTSSLAGYRTPSIISLSLSRIISSLLHSHTKNRVSPRPHRSLLSVHYTKVYRVSFCLSTRHPDRYKKQERKKKQGNAASRKTTSQWSLHRTKTQPLIYVHVQVDQCGNKPTHTYHPSLNPSRLDRNHAAHTQTHKLYE